MDEETLQSINRRHSARQALDACALLVDGGLSVNVDLIYGFPGQSEDSLRRDLEMFAGLGTQSFTLYNLRLNDRAPMATVVAEMQRIDLRELMRWRRFVELVTDELGYDQTRWHMFRHRERSDPGHVRAPGIEALASGRDVGIGVSAYSHLGETIYRNHVSFDGYMRRIEAGESPVEDVFPFGPLDRRTLFVARTLGEGGPLTLADYEQSFGRRFDEDFGRVLDRMRRADLVRETAGRLALTETGRLVYDLVTIAFYPDDARQWLDRQQHSTRRRSAPASAPVEFARREP
jgi:oxygen-independent coproporphyrinogen-3 oxidase